jgi:hypothetical protein
LAAEILLATQLLPATIVGTVRDEQSSAPLSGAVVALPDLDRATLTDEVGRYELSGTPSGPHHITVRLLGYAPRTLHALVPPEGTLTIDILLRPEPLRMASVQVVGPRAVVRGLDSTETRPFPDREVSQAALRNLPLLSEPDALQALAGGEASQRPETPGGLHLRGGATDQTAYLLDGVPVFSPFHAAGISSAWNPDAISRLYLSSSEPLVGEPHALSGAVEAVTRTPGPRLRGQATLTTTQTRVTVDGPMGSRGAGYVAGVRLGLPDWLVPPEEASYIRGSTADMLGKIDTPFLGGHARLLAYATENELDASEVVERDLDSTRRRNRFEWDSYSLGLEWRRSVRTTTLRLLGWAAGCDAGAQWRAVPARVEMTSDRRDVGLLAAAERGTERSSWTAGLRVEGIDTSYRVRPDSLSDPSYTTEAWTGVGTLFARLARPLGSRADLDLGSAVTAARGDFWLDLRAQGRWNAGGPVSIVASVARTHQFAQSLRNPESVVANLFPVDLFLSAEESGIPVARSDQAILGIDIRPSSGVRLGAQGYLRESQGLVLVAPETGEPFATDGYSIGSSSARGVSAEAALQGARYGIVASYGHEHVRLEASGLEYQPEHSARHRFEGGITFFPGATASIRLGGVAALGRRTTIAANEFEWEACNLLDQGCEFMGSPHHDGEELGGTELPDYVRVDLGVRKHWHLGMSGRDMSFAVFGTATNILGRKNVMTYARDPDDAPTPIEMRPRAPLVVGVDWAF